MSCYEDEHFFVYSLPGLLPEGDTLVLNRALRVLSQVTARGDLVEQCRISRDDMALLVALLSASPQYCLDATLLAAKTGESIERCTRRVAWAKAAKEPEVYDSLIRPVRGSISRLRTRLQAFHLDLRALVSQGYLLIRLSSPRANGDAQGQRSHEAESEQRRFHVYPLPGLYPEEVCLVLDTQERVLTRLSRDGRRVIEQVVLSEIQMYLLDELFAAYPDYCPLAVLLAAYLNENVEQCQAHVNQAFDSGTAPKELRGVYAPIASSRTKLRTLGLGADLLRATGYLLVAADDQADDQREEER
jgi:hypothetical protein